MLDHARILALSGIAFVLACAGCGGEGETQSPARATGTAPQTDHDDGDDHAHEEVALGTAMVGELAVECWQAHGQAGPGKELHLVVKLPYRDDGATVVRAWIGTEDRLASRVARGEYAASHDDYDIHAVAPDPLADDAKWWIEVEQPDGTMEVGSIGLLE